MQPAEVCSPVHCAVHCAIHFALCLTVHCALHCVCVGDWFMTVVKRCEKEVDGSWTDKQAQAVTWLNFFIPHYRGLCVTGDGCPAKHSAPDQAPAAGEDEKRFIDGEDPQDEQKVAALEELIAKMKVDVAMFVHGHNTCRVESSHNEKAVYCCKRVEMWRNWRGKCRLVQLFHNHGVEKTAEMVRQCLGWLVTEDVRLQWRKVDRDKAKHRAIKADPSYNRRQRQLKHEVSENRLTHC